MLVAVYIVKFWKSKSEWREKVNDSVNKSEHEILV